MPTIPPFHTVRTAQLPARSLGTPNYRFNRVETPGRHIYVSDFGPAFHPETRYDGWTKVRLLHGPGFSIIAVDQLYVKDNNRDQLAWFQPFFFTANLLERREHVTEVSIFVDLSWGHRYELRFSNESFVRAYEDGSQLFRCILRGPHHLMRLSTGTARWYGDQRIALRVFHHTTSSAAPMIKASQLRGSSRNILGDRLVSNYTYAYVTALDRITTSEDLAMIAMADAGVVTYRVDPKIACGEAIVETSIYEQKVIERSATVALEVDAAHLVPAHLWRHDDRPTYYEIFQPFNYRVALQPNAGLPLMPENVSASILKPHTFALLGSTDDPENILAPLRESGALTLKVEVSAIDICTFWIDNANTNLYDSKDIESQAFIDSLPADP